MPLPLSFATWQPVRLYFNSERDIPQACSASQFGDEDHAGILRWCRVFDPSDLPTPAMHDWIPALLSFAE
jgi:hypothetical protein